VTIWWAKASASRRHPPVPADQPVLPDRHLQPRQPGHQNHHDQHRVRAAEASEPARTGQQPPRARPATGGIRRSLPCRPLHRTQAGQDGTPGHEPAPRRRTGPARAHIGRTCAGALGRGDRLAHHQPIVIRQHEGIVTSASALLMNTARADVWPSLPPGSISRARLAGIRRGGGGPGLRRPCGPPGRPPPLGAEGSRRRSCRAWHRGHLCHDGTMKAAGSAGRR
jgi:hypothetical protein